MSPLPLIVAGPERSPEGTKRRASHHQRKSDPNHLFGSSTKFMGNEQLVAINAARSPNAAESLQAPVGDSVSRVPKSGAYRETESDPNRQYNSPKGSAKRDSNVCQ